jgi:hypothetical protein
MRAAPDEVVDRRHVIRVALYEMGDGAAQDGWIRCTT